MLRFDGEQLFWNGLSVRELNIKELSNDERFEFLCAISAHDPIDVEVAISRLSNDASGEGM